MFRCNVWTKRDQRLNVEGVSITWSMAIRQSTNKYPPDLKGLHILPQDEGISSPVLNHVRDQ